MNKYQKYQLQWMIDHGYSIQDLIRELTELQFEDPEDSDRISTPISELFNEWEHDVGFGSNIWACEDEWRDVEGNMKKECGICGEMFDMSDMVRSEGSDTGWICIDCQMSVHPEYDDGEQKWQGIDIQDTAIAVGNIYLQDMGTLNGYIILRLNGELNV